MKRLIATILLVAVIVSGIAVPEKKASANKEEHQAGVPYSWEEIYDDDNGNYYYYEKDYYGTVVYQIDTINRNVIFDNRIFDAEIQNKSENLDERKILIGDKEQLICDIKYNLADGYTDSNLRSNIIWSSSDTSIATIDKTTGLMTAKKQGKVTITAQISFNNQKITREINILKNQTDIVTKGANTKCQIKEFISYDNKGNLVWTITIKNCSKKRYMYVAAAQACYVEGINWRKDYHLEYGYNKKYKINGYTSDLTFDLKSGKSKTVKITMKKSKLKGKCPNLQEESDFWKNDFELYRWKDVKKAKKTGKVIEPVFSTRSE